MNERTALKTPAAAASPYGLTPNGTPLHRGRGQRGEGTQRERRPGVWEVRVPTGPDPVTGHSRHVSVTVHGSREDAAAERVRLLAWCRGIPR
jgi:hypothetical protein